MNLSPTPLPLTFEEHRELGRELRAAVIRLHELRKLVVSVYGPNNRAAERFAAISEDLERLCAAMQAQAEHDCPGFPVQGFYR